MGFRIYIADFPVSGWLKRIGTLFDAVFPQTSWAKRKSFFFICSSIVNGLLRCRSLSSCLWSRVFIAFRSFNWLQMERNIQGFHLACMYLSNCLDDRQAVKISWKHRCQKEIRTTTYCQYLTSLRKESSEMTLLAWTSSQRVWIFMLKCTDYC